MRQALDETERNQIPHVDKNEWNRRSSSVDRDRIWGRLGDDDLWTKRDELSHERGDLLGPDLRVTILDLKIPAHDITALVQSLQPSLHLFGTPMTPRTPTR